jgi:hypothetical protein
VQQSAFAEVGNALLAIREAKLYRAEHGTFEAYCLKRWGFSASRARRLIGAAEITENLKSVPIGTLPKSEAVARPLTKLPASDQPAAWQAATDKAQSEGRNVRARDVEEAVEEKRAIRAQRARRNLTDSDIVRLVVELDKRRTAGRPKAGEEKLVTGVTNKKSSQETADIIGVNRGKVEQARAVLDKAAPEVKPAIRARA